MTNEHITSGNDSMEWVTIANYHGAGDAHMDRLRLEAEGIDCNLLDEISTTLRPFHSHASGGIRLQVRRRDAARAEDLLGAAWREADAERAKCPACGSEKIYRRDLVPPVLWLTLMVFAFSVIVFPVGFWLLIFYAVPMRCEDCRHAWRVRSNLFSRWRSRA